MSLKYLRSVYRPKGSHHHRQTQSPPPWQSYTAASHYSKQQILELHALDAGDRVHLATALENLGQLGRVCKRGKFEGLGGVRHATSLWLKGVVEEEEGEEEEEEEVKGEKEGGREDEDRLRGARACCKGPLLLKAEKCLPIHCKFISYTNQKLCVSPPAAARSLLSCRRCWHHTGSALQHASRVAGFEGRTCFQNAESSS
jgi:hypothetical protein